MDHYLKVVTWMLQCHQWHAMTHTAAHYSSAKTKGADSVSDRYKAQYRYGLHNEKLLSFIIDRAAKKCLLIITD